MDLQDLQDLQDLRFEIDKIDNELIQLFQKRMDISVEVAVYKKEHNQPVYDPVREQEILEKLSGKAKEENKDSIISLYKLLFEISRAGQEKIKNSL